MNQYKVGPRSIAKLVYNSNFTMVYMVLITIVTGANLNQRSHHWGVATL